MHRSKQHLYSITSSARQAALTNRDVCAVATPARWACQCLDDKRIAKRIRDQLHKENAMPRTKVSVADVAEVAPGLWSNAIRAGDMLFISGQVARPFEGGTEIVGKDEYEQTRQIFSRIDRIIKAAGGTMDNLVKMTIYVVDIKNNTEVWRARREFFAGDFPASTLVEVRSLAKPEVLVEIETVAYLGRS
jgi:2-iminobutanoate/2-iminopropanoate deaminase